MPIGYAAAATVIVGAVGAVLGMAQVMYVGVLGGKLGLPQFGGDIGFLLSGSFAAM